MYSERDYNRPNYRRPHHSNDASILGPLIIANVVVFVLQTLGGREFTALLVLHTPSIQALQIWRLVSYMFAHASLLHIFFNMWALFLFGRYLESYLGSNRFLNLYFASGIISGLLWVVFNWTSQTPVLGASGSVFGVMVATAMVAPNEIIYIIPFPFPIKFKYFMVGCIIFEVFFLAGESNGTANLIHLMGAATGFAYMRFVMGGKGRGRRGRTTSTAPVDSVKRWFKHLKAKWKHRHFSVMKDEPKADDASNRSPDDNDELNVDDILDKLGKYGRGSLTKEELKRLEEARKRFRERR